MIWASDEYNTNGHLTKVTTPNGRETEFAVNGLGVRTSRTETVTPYTSLRAPRPPRHSERRALRVIASTAPSTSLRAQRSPYGSVPDNPDRVVEKHSGLLRRYAPRNDVWVFGRTAGSAGSSSSPYMPSGLYGYAGAWGYRTDGDAGLMHVGARYYDAQVGRFITRDTVLSEHPYLYCEHDPVNAVDPSGHIRQPIQWYVNFVQSIVAKDWGTLMLLIDIATGDELPPGVREILENLPSPKRAVTPVRVGKIRGLLDQMVVNIRKISNDPPEGGSLKHHLKELTTAARDAWRKLDR